MIIVNTIVFNGIQLFTSKSNDKILSNLVKQLVRFF